MAMSTVASEKNSKKVVYWQRVLQTVTSLRVVSLVFRGHDLLEIANITPAGSDTFAMEKS